MTQITGHVLSELGGKRWRGPRHFYECLSLAKNSRDEQVMRVEETSTRVIMPLLLDNVR